MSEVPILRLNQELSDRIGAHGAETYPHECCGALLGRDLDPPTAHSSDGASVASREVTALFPLVNRRDDSPRNRFSVTSEDVRDAEKAAREKGIDVVGWYHSHPDHPAKPSQFDQDHAWPWYSYIIVSVANGRPEAMTSWRLADDRTQFTPENLEIAGKDAAAQSAS
jgi:proteasome lid subunit RPN8/RPN11